MKEYIIGKNEAGQRKPYGSISSKNDLREAGVNWIKGQIKGKTKKEVPKLYGFKTSFGTP